jgi:hypothetical protein
MNDHRRLTLPRLNVVLVQLTIEPTNEDVIEDTKRNGRSDGIVRGDVASDTDLGRELHIGKEECAEELGEGTSPEPCVNRVKHQFVAAICVPE